MGALPPYANTPDGRALIAAILENPVSRADRDGIGGVGERFIGKNASRLRGLWDRWWAEEFNRLDEHYRITGVWLQAEADAIAAAERPDELLRRLIDEGRLVEVHGDPLRRAA